MELQLHTFNIFNQGKLGSLKHCITGKKNKTVEGGVWENTTCLRIQVQSQCSLLSKWLLKFRLFHLQV